jgi:hypothetical protein
LSSKDEPDWYTTQFGGSPLQENIGSRVSPGGRYLAFMSERPLTGYDNTDAVSGQPDEEVYLYDAVTDRLVCASCNPTGARPVGVLDNDKLLADEWGLWGENRGSGSPAHWLAGNIPGWTTWQHQSRYLSDSGRLFFTSPDALVPGDTNGLEDVYEYEPAGVGGCSAGSATFGQRSGGCVGLISSGTSSAESAFMDASETGNDVFFVTTSRLVGEDYDTTYDVYDAHVCSASLPCMSGPVSPPPCTSGDACKAAPSPQPEIFGPAPSATFSGTGNVAEATKSVVRHKHRPKPKTKRKRHARHPGRRANRTWRSRTGRASGKGRV